MPSVYVTRKGMDLLDHRLSEAIAKLKHTQSQKAEAADIGGDNWHDNFAFEDLVRQETMFNRQISDIRTIQDQLVLVPMPRDARQVQIGHIVTIEDEDGGVREFRVGGYGETDLHSTPPTLEYGAPIISPFMGMEVGTEAYVQIKGKRTSVLLTNIRKDE